MKKETHQVYLFQYQDYRNQQQVLHYLIHHLDHFYHFHVIIHLEQDLVHQILKMQCHQHLRHHHRQFLAF